MITHRVSADRVIFRHHPWQVFQDFKRETGAEGGINFGFFRRGTSHPHDSSPAGIIKVGSWVTGWDPTLTWHALGRHLDDSLQIFRSPMTEGGDDLRHEYEWLCTAGPIVLLNGQVGIQDEGRWPGLSGIRPTSRVERVGIGLTDDGTAVFKHHPSATVLEKWPCS